MSSSQQSEPPRPSSHTAPESPNGAEAPQPSTRQVIRVPRLALLGVGLLLFGTGLTAASWPVAMGWLLILPIVAGIWVFRVRTVITPEAITARRFVGSDVIAWESVVGLHFPDRRWGRVVLTDKSEKSLPLVRFDLLPQLAAASGGRITDPYAAAAAAAAAEAEDRDREEAENAENDGEQAPKEQ
ncbi:PH domain-containing protein [Rhodococcus sp. ARC_M12]|uniref:PH domain-containing protein n=1 Tax=Rhodococcus sp. ARC_M12 TaxID=2928854 RepID=UPI001FB35FF1|nr:PH domain-containing protein [Rhodococcus sp. ARC_M12]MCJ0976572.1 PH domain-containing protein [Rhodococcus sp. ARC_M12]